MKVLVHSEPGIGDIIQALSVGKTIKKYISNAQIDLIIRGSYEIYQTDMHIFEL